MNITIVGTGYSGLVTGTCFAELGVNVKCVDPDGQKINRLVYGDIPIYEPGLEAMVTRNVNANRLTFQADYEGAFDNADVVFCAIDPKLDRDGSTNLKPVIDGARAQDHRARRHLAAAQRHHRRGIASTRRQGRSAI